MCCAVGANRAEWDSIAANAEQKREGKNLRGAVGRLSASATADGQRAPMTMS